MISNSRFSSVFAKKTVVIGTLGAIYLIFWCSPALAGRFVNLVETAAFPRGEGEVVQASVFSVCNGQPCSTQALEFQVGVEYGLLDGFQVGFALPRVSTVWVDDVSTTQVGGTALWGLYNFVDTESMGWGLSAIAVFAEGLDTQAGDLALLVEKPLDDWTLVYNGTLGRAWDHGEAAGTMELMTHRLGVSYQVSRKIFLGLEMDWYLERDQSWEKAGHFLGPNLSVDTSPIWITAAAQFAMGPPEVIPDQVFQIQAGLPF